MQFICKKSTLSGDVDIPGSKSHTIRAVAIAALAQGESVIDAPLVSADTLSAARAITAFHSDIDIRPDAWRISGGGSSPQPRRDEIDVGNSGTSLRILMGSASLMPPTAKISLTGDQQIQTRPAGPLITALNDLGAQVTSINANDCAPITVQGRLRGGKTRVEAKSSQYLTSLLLACPLADGDSEIEVPLLYEPMYVQMTLDWLARQNVRVEHKDMRRFHIPGSQNYTPFRARISADFSSATFFFGAGALAGNDITCCGLDMADSQPDKAAVDYLKAMGAEVEVAPECVRIRSADLHGIEIDMNGTPDALPVMAVIGCFARGETILRNVAQARIKETDRIAVMAAELGKMGADITELEDGMIIRESALHGAEVDGHHDHRVVMALALAGMNAPGETIISTAEAAGVTFPEFHTLMTQLGGNLTAAEE